MEFPGEKLSEVFHAVENMGGEVLAWLHGLLSSEKIKALRLAAESSAAGALAWFDKVLPPETRTEQINRGLHISKPYLIAAGALAVLVILCRSCGGGGRSGKTMKAPGRNYKMQRADFEGDPKGYFREFRARKRK